MKVKTEFISNIIPDQYSKKATLENIYKKQPVNSFPFSVEEIPGSTQYIAFTFIDHDAVPFCGFSWIHWLVADVPVNDNVLSFPENFSRGRSEKVQGTNSFASVFIGENDPRITQAYVGPTPLDEDHLYTLTVYALNDKLNLEQGFYLNDLYKALASKVVDQVEINLTGKY